MWLRRLRARWRAAGRVIVWQANHWKSVLLHMKVMGASEDGVLVSPFQALLRDFKSPASLAEQEMSAAEGPMMDLAEGRFSSLERYVAFLVLFHAMALRVSCTSFPLPPWDLSRSQSILRVASTAAPVSGAEVAAQLDGPAGNMRFDAGGGTS